MRYAVMGWLLLGFTVATPLPAQRTTEERLARLEEQVAALEATTRRALLAAELARNENVRFGVPGGRGVVLAKSHFVLSFDTLMKVPEWVAYQLTAENLVGTANRTDDFRADPELRVGTRSELVDYRLSGFDRGHMAPAAAFKRSRAAMSETFLLSNMAPTHPQLNRRMWSRLEDEVRDLANAHGNIYVITGPLYRTLTDQPLQPVPTIGPNRVAVPSHFYTVVLCRHSDTEFETFAFVMHNSELSLSGAPRNYLVSVDQVERATGLDFFAALPDALEQVLESQAATLWPIQGR